MRLLVTGSDGLVGTNILPILEKEFEVVPFVESRWDITDRSQGEAVIEQVAPDALINLAAITDVDGCEDKKELAFRVNAEAPGILAEICARRNIAVLHFSTDYVFDGLKGSPYTEDDVTNPLSIYGRSKRAGEEKVIAAHPAAVIVRTEWIYGDGGESFITKVVRAARERGTVEVVDDQSGAPTYAKDLARPVAALIKKQGKGIFHLTNGGSCTWYEFARHVFSALNIDVTCKRVSSDDLKRKAMRPRYSVLDCTRVTTFTSIRMRGWQEAVEEYLRYNESNILFRRTPPA
jgi:dTDP-4-dehydrorhamnose reductase